MAEALNQHVGFSKRTHTGEYSIFIRSGVMSIMLVLLRLYLTLFYVEEYKCGSTELPARSKVPLLIFCSQRDIMQPNVN